VVTDIQAAHRGLSDRGVKVCATRHKFPRADWTGGWRPGPDPEQRDYASIADFADPNGVTWVIHEIGHS